MGNVLVTVTLHGQWLAPDVKRELARGPVAVDVADGGTVADLLRALAQRFGPRFRTKLLRTTGDVRPDVRVFVHDRQVDPAVTLLQPGSEPAEVSLVLLAPMAGG